MRAPAAGALPEGSRDLDQRLDLRRQATSPRRARHRRLHREERSSRAPPRDDHGARDRNNRRTAQPDKRLTETATARARLQRPALRLRVRVSTLAVLLEIVRTRTAFGPLLVWVQELTGVDRETDAGLPGGQRLRQHDLRRDHLSAERTGNVAYLASVCGIKSICARIRRASRWP